MKKLILVFFVLPFPLLALDGFQFENPRIQVAPGASMAAGFLEIKNNTDRPRRIVTAFSSGASATELHTHTNEDGVMKMRRVDSFPIPEKSSLSLNPDGYHLMIIGLNHEIKEGEPFPITLQFENGETAEVIFTVETQGAAMDHSQHMGHNSTSGDHSMHAGHNHNVADMLPPAGVMGAHMHHPGAWIVDYRSMVMDMRGLQDGSHGVLPLQVLYGIYQDPRVQMPMTGLAPPSPLLPAARIEQNQFRYMSVGTRMSMEMHMISAMYQYSNDTMLMVMVPYVVNRMKMIANNFETANMSAKGVGDVSLTATFRAWSRGDHAFFLGTGITLPTGSIDEKDWMPQMGKSQVAYAMQPGAGTPSFLAQAAYTDRIGALGFGAQYDGTFRYGKNDNNYRAGNRHSGTAWISWRFADWFSMSARGLQQKWDNVSGQDPSLDPMMDPGNDPRLQGGHRTDVLAGANFVITGGPLSGMRFLAEFGRPVRQHLNGPQMSTHWTANFAAQASF